MRIRSESKLEIIRRRLRVYVESIHRAREHRVVADGGGELDKTFLAETAVKRLKGRFADAMGVDDFAHETDHLSILGGKMFDAFFLVQGANGFHADARLLPVIDVRAPLVRAVELPRRR